MPDVVVEYRPDESRFVATVTGRDEVAFLEVDTGKSVWSFTHTAVPPSLAGSGVGSALVAGALDHARKLGVKVIPHCPFVAAYVRRHPEALDLVPDRFRHLVEDGA